MAENPRFNRVLQEMVLLHDRKNHDYAQDTNPYSNFEVAGIAAGVPVLKVLDVLIGIKQARLTELTEAGKVPNNESIRDTLIDRAVYATIAVAVYDSQHEKEGQGDDE